MTLLKNFIEMTQTVVDGKAKHSMGTIPRKMDTPFKAYLKGQLEEHYQD